MTGCSHRDLQGGITVQFEVEWIDRSMFSALRRSNRCDRYAGTGAPASLYRGTVFPLAHKPASVAKDYDRRASARNDGAVGVGPGRKMLHLPCG